MNEHYRGSASEIQFIRTYLQDIRRGPPDNLRVRSCFPLASFAEPLTTQLRINTSLFEEICGYAGEVLKAKSPAFRLLDRERFIVGVLGRDDTDPGGFHSAYSSGFQYISNYGFVVLPNPNVIKHEDIRTLELARSYLHDSIHSATFRTFRKVPEASPGTFPVYREQYGINFRKHTGISYSLPSLTRRAPWAINLNLLMDGLNVILVAQAMRGIAPSINLREVNDMEAQFVADIRGEWSILSPTFRGWRFYAGVVRPSEEFIAMWGGQNLIDLLFQAMMTGKMRELCKHFDLRLGRRRAWKHLFISPSWSSPPQSTSRPSTTLPE